MSDANAVIYIVSDSVGETAEQVMKAAAVQYENCDFQIENHSYISETAAIDEIIQKARNKNSIIIFTLMMPKLKEHLMEKAEENQINYVDVLGPSVTALSKLFNKEPSYEPRAFRKLDEKYFSKVDAMEFAVEYDDCKDPKGILKADVVLLGVSRTSKTPLSIYLATKNLKVTNIPLLPEVRPPKELFEIPSSRIIGLVNSPSQLNAIRIERLKAYGLSEGGNYASLERIAQELKYAEEIMKKIGCKVIDVTDKAIEETANIILQILKEVNE